MVWRDRALWKLFASWPRVQQRFVASARFRRNEGPQKILLTKAQESKLSPHGHPHSLLEDCLDRIREARRQAERRLNYETSAPSPVIAELTDTEKRMVHQILKRVDPMKEVTPNEAHKGSYIDPFWNPFGEVEKLKTEIRQEFVDQIRFIGQAKAEREREMTVRQLRIAYKLTPMNPLEEIEDKTRQRTDIPNDPQYPTMPRTTPERYWDPSTLRRQALYNRNRPITWRDLHILKLFVAESGMVLPRRLTMATRRQQIRIYKAIKQAQAMGVFPRDSKPLDTEQMRIEDPLQALTDIMTTKYIRTGDCRAKAMLQAIAAKHPLIDARRFQRLDLGKRRRNMKLRRSRARFARRKPQPGVAVSSTRTKSARKLP